MTQAANYTADLKAALAQRNRAAINQAIRTLLDQNYDLGIQWKALAMAAKQNGEVTLALQAMDRYAAGRSDDPSINFELAALRAQLGLLSEAAEYLAKVPDTLPTPASNAYTRGTIASNLGDWLIARDQLRRSTRLDPYSGQAWLALSMLPDLEEADRQKIRLARPDSDVWLAHEHSALLYAQARVAAEENKYPAAFTAFSAGARLMAANRPYDHAKDQSDSEQAISGWARADFKECANSSGKPGRNRPIFVTGLPRSGTTLVEQILNSNRAVSGGDELGFFRLLHQDIGGRSFEAYQSYLSNGGTAQKLQQLYHHLLDQRFPGQLLVVDKSLNLSRSMGLLAHLFPEAPIIWMRRDPMDCAWSCFQTWFLRGHNWSWSLDTIAAHFAIEDRLLAFWQAHIGSRLLVCDYSELVRTPQEVIPKLADHCKIPFNEQMLRPHELDRIVTTASVAQVRKPINQSGLGTAAPYLEWLTSFTQSQNGH